MLKEQQKARVCWAAETIARGIGDGSVSVWLGLYFKDFRPSWAPRAVVHSRSHVWLFAMGCSPPGYMGYTRIHGISQARILEWVDIFFSSGSSQPRNQTHVSFIAGRFFIIFTTCSLSQQRGHDSTYSSKWPLSLLLVTRNVVKVICFIINETQTLELYTCNGPCQDPSNSSQGHTLCKIT